MKQLIGAVGLCLLAGCTTPLERPQAVAIGSTAALALPGDIRLITERPYVPKTIICAEPSPDTAKALSTLAQLEASAQTPAGVQVGVGGGRSTAEALTALAGRTAAVVALRDGLFRACEARANGLISRASYALILSQYGDLLVTLTLGEAAAGSNAVAVATASAPPAPDLTITLPSSSAAPKGSTPATPIPGPAKGTSGSPAVTPVFMPISLTAQTTTAPAAKPTKGAAKRLTSAPPAAAPMPVATAKPSTSDTAGASPGSASAAIAKSYFDSAKSRGQNAFFSVCVAIGDELDGPNLQAFGDPNTRAALSGACVAHFLRMGALEDAEINADNAAKAKDEAMAKLLNAQAAALDTPSAQPRRKARGSQSAKWHNRVKPKKNI